MRRVLGKVARVLRAVRLAVREELRPDGPLYPGVLDGSSPFSYVRTGTAPGYVAIDFNIVSPNGNAGSPGGWKR